MYGSRVLCEEILSLFRFRLEHCWSLWGGRSPDADEKEVHSRAAARGGGPGGKSKTDALNSIRREFPELDPNWPVVKCR